MSSVAIPSAADLQTRVRRSLPKLLMYNPAEEWFVYEYGGVPYYFPPDLGEGRTTKHPVSGEIVPADGRLAVSSRFGPLLHPTSRKPIGNGSVPSHTAELIVTFFCENFAVRGITFLEGEPSIDKPRMEAAKKVYRNWRRASAQEVQNARAEFVNNWLNQPNNKGRIPPPPTPLQIQAQEFLDAMAEERRSEMAYVCQFGCYETNDWKNYARHMRVAHSQVVTPPETVIEDAVVATGAKPIKTAPIPDNVVVGSGTGAAEKIQERAREHAEELNKLPENAKRAFAKG